MPMNAPCIIGFPRWTPEVTFSGGSYASGFPVTNVSSLPLSRNAQTTDLQASSTTMTARLAAVRPVRLIAVVRHNLGIDAEMRVVFSDASARVDGGEVDAPLVQYLQTGFTFARAGAGTYFDGAGLLQTAGTDVPRFDHQGHTGAPRGLYIEPAATNLAYWSNDLAAGPWAAPNGLSVATSVYAGPDGALSLARLTASATSSGGILRQAVSLPTATDVTLSLIVAAGTFDRIGLNFGTVGASAGLVTTFDFSAGAFTVEPDGSATASVELLRHDLYRLSLTGQTAATYMLDSGGSTILDHSGSPILGPSAVNVDITLPSAVGSAAWTPASTDTIYAGFVQVEQASTPTSYIATGSAAAARAADALYVSLSANEYVFTIESDGGTTVATTTVASALHEITLPAGATRIQRFTATPSRIVEDTGWFDVWEAVYQSDDLMWEDDRFWTGQYDASERSSYVWTRMVLFSTTVEGLEARIEFRDPNNADGHLEFGMIEIAAAWQSSVQFDWGAQFGFQDRVEVVQSQDAKYFNRLDEPRVFAGEFSFLDRDEAMSYPFEIRRQFKTDTPFVWLPHPDDTANWLRTAYLARLVQPQLHAYAIPDHDRVSLSLEEVIE